MGEEGKKIWNQGREQQVPEVKVRACGLGPRCAQREPLFQDGGGRADRRRRSADQVYLFTVLPQLRRGRASRPQVEQISV